MGTSKSAERGPKAHLRGGPQKAMIPTKTKQEEPSPAAATKAAQAATKTAKSSISADKAKKEPYGTLMGAPSGSSAGPPPQGPLQHPKNSKQHLRLKQQQQQKAQRQDKHQQQQQQQSAPSAPSAEKSLFQKDKAKASAPHLKDLKGSSVALKGFQGPFKSFIKRRAAKGASARLPQEATGPPAAEGASDGKSKRSRKLLSVANPFEVEGEEEFMSDEDEERNRIGDVPLWWYDNYKHVGELNPKP